MTSKVKVTEALRKEIKKKIASLTPEWKWYLIARDEREAVHWAYLRIDEEGKAKEFSDDGLTQMIYGKTKVQAATASDTMQWLKEKELWIGAQFKQLAKSEE